MFPVKPEKIVLFIDVHGAGLHYYFLIVGSTSVTMSHLTIEEMRVIMFFPASQLLRRVSRFFSSTARLLDAPSPFLMSFRFTQRSITKQTPSSSLRQSTHQVK